MRNSLSVLSILERYLFVMDDTSIFLLGSKQKEVENLGTINLQYGDVTTPPHLPYLNFPSHESAMAAPRMGVK